MSMISSSIHVIVIMDSMRVVVSVMSCVVTMCIIIVHC